MPQPAGPGTPSRSGAEQHGAQARRSAQQGPENDHAVGAGPVAQRLSCRRDRADPARQQIGLARRPLPPVGRPSAAPRVPARRAASATCGDCGRSRCPPTRRAAGSGCRRAGVQPGGAAPRTALAAQGRNPARRRAGEASPSRCTPSRELAVETRNPDAEAWKRWICQQTLCVVETDEGPVEFWHDTMRVDLPLVTYATTNVNLCRGTRRRTWTP